MSPKSYHNSLSGTVHTISVRLDEPVYQALSTACMTSGLSMNSIVNQALATYFTTQPPDHRRSHYEETVRRLAGG